jgi:hypothetical protein
MRVFQFEKVWIGATDERFSPHGTTNYTSLSELLPEVVICSNCAFEMGDMRGQYFDLPLLPGVRLTGRGRVAKIIVEREGSAAAHSQAAI